MAIHFSLVKIPQFFLNAWFIYANYKYIFTVFEFTKNKILSSQTEPDHSRHNSQQPTYEKT